MRALALIDGEHYPDVVVEALGAVRYEVVGAVMLGGTEKLRGGTPDYGVPLWDSLAEALAQVEVDVVVDLSDEPVVGPRRRFRLASHALAQGLPYVGADFRLDPVRFAPYSQPALAVIGTGKRVGKTAVAGHVARLLTASRELVVVAMGRGGPAEPVVSQPSPTIAELLALSRSGVHAAGAASPANRSSPTSTRPRGSPPRSAPTSSCSRRAAPRCRRWRQVPGSSSRAPTRIPRP